MWQTLSQLLQGTRRRENPPGVYEWKERRKHLWLISLLVREDFLPGKPKWREKSALLMMCKQQILHLTGRGKSRECPLRRSRLELTWLEWQLIMAQLTNLLFFDDFGFNYKRAPISSCAWIPAPDGDDFLKNWTSEFNPFGTVIKLTQISEHCCSVNWSMLASSRGLGSKIKVGDDAWNLWSCNGTLV